MDNTKIAGTHLNKGAELLSEGKAKLAIKEFKIAAKKDPNMVAAHFDLALAYQQTGEDKKAMRSLEKTVELKPDDYEAQNLLGHMYMNQGDRDPAFTCFERAIAANPLMADAYYNLGVCYMQTGKYEKALENYNQSLKILPDNSMVLNNIGVAYEDMGKTNEALKYFNKALDANPENTLALSNLGAYYIHIDHVKAAEYFQKALEYNPTMSSSAYNLGTCLRLMGDNEGAVIQFEKAIELSPDSSVVYGQLFLQLKAICDWDKAKKIEPVMRRMTDQDIKRSLQTAETPFISVIYDENPKRNYDIAVSWSKYIESRVAPFKKDYKFKKPQRKKIRIGYLSNDYKDHATSHLIMGLFRHHDRKKFDIHTYSYGIDDKSKYRRELKKITKFTDVATFTHEQAADLIHKDKIDILVDLKGHTTNCRLEISALRPSPIQINYLGFPGTTGADFFDYFITDNALTTKGMEKYFTEKLIYMPDSYQITDDTQKISKTIRTRSKIMLPEDKFIFCSFNQPYKITPQVFDSWMRILKKVPNTVICLQAKNNTHMENLRDEAIKRKVDPHRLVFSISLEKSMHLARLRLCDLALDTFPCNGHTTTSDCLWAGTPVVAIRGKHFASRVSSSLLSAVGMPELVCKDQKEYEKMAIKIAKSSKQLESLKTKLEENRTTKALFDTKRFTKNLETAYMDVWDLYKKGKKPKSIHIKGIN